jgi:hypothetical protein
MGNWWEYRLQLQEHDELASSICERCPTTNATSSCVGNARTLTGNGYARRGLRLCGRLGAVGVELAVGERLSHRELRNTFNIDHAAMVADWQVRESFGAIQGQAARPGSGSRTCGRVPRSATIGPGVWSQRALLELHAPRSDLCGSVLDHCSEMHAGEGVRPYLNGYYACRPRKPMPKKLEW